MVDIFNKHNFIYLFHILFVGPLFLYVGIKNIQTNKYLFTFIEYLGIIVILYHSFKAYKKIMDNKSAWINYFHIFLIGPLLFIIGYNKQETSNKFFQLLIMAAMATIGYNIYNIFFN